MELKEYRTLFPVTSQQIYLNHAAISPLSTRVTDKLEWYLDERGFGKIDVYKQVSEIRVNTRQRLGRMINAAPRNIAFIGNTSEGFNWLVNGLQWQEGDQIILTDYEFPSNVYPFLNMQRHGVEIVYVPNRRGSIHLDDIKASITPKTRLLSISFVEFSNGFRNDLPAIGQLCKENGIIFSVDGIQGIGAMNLDVQQCGIDFLSNGGHKWLMGIMGAGFMYINEQLFDRLTPSFTGWLAVEDSWNFFDYDLTFLPDARRFEYGTYNFMGLTGLSASIELLMEAGIERIEKHLLQLGEQLVSGLTETGMTFMGSDQRRHWSGIYSFSGDHIEALFEDLKANQIIGSLRNGMIRLAPHFYNTKQEIDEVIHHIANFYQK
ncbi:MAG: aminotransferase class V-fold PLP-dependent enzyme [Caldithrix sp.]|nr:aminotransferase class V-fold PLP-dependent enzyme [Caldithrix sp.]